MLERSTGPVLVHVVRDGVVESVHRGHAAVVDVDGAPVRVVGDDVVVYPRSTLKPLQAAAIVEVLASAGRPVGVEAVAVMSASHAGTDDQIVEVAHLLALAGLDEDALACPPALPADESALLAATAPARIAHNCSGKHAGFLLAQTILGAAPDAYLDERSEVQRWVAGVLASACDVEPQGPGVDGCGAPAWRLPLTGVALAYARLAAATAGSLAAVAAAMRARPDLVGGSTAPDTALMAADARVLGKRGAEAMFAAGMTGDHGPVGVAVKIEDGGARAAAPVAGALLRDLGAAVPERIVAPAVHGGGRPHGTLSVRLPSLA